MSNPRYGWWGYAKYIIRVYPIRKQAYDALHEPSLEVNISGIPAGNQTSRTVENIAIRELPHTEQKEYEAVRQAIQATKHLSNGNERLRIMDMVYWKQSHSLSGAAQVVGYSYDRAKQLHREFVRLVAKYYGFLDAGSK